MIPEETISRVARLPSLMRRPRGRPRRNRLRRLLDGVAAPVPLFAGAPAAGARHSPAQRSVHAGAEKAISYQYQSKSRVTLRPLSDRYRMRGGVFPPCPGRRVAGLAIENNKRQHRPHMKKNQIIHLSAALLTTLSAGTAQATLNIPSNGSDGDFTLAARSTCGRGKSNFLPIIILLFSLATYGFAADAPLQRTNTAPPEARMMQTQHSVTNALAEACKQDMVSFWEFCKKATGATISRRDRRGNTVLPSHPHGGRVGENEIIFSGLHMEPPRTTELTEETQYRLFGKWLEAEKSCTADSYRQLINNAASDELLKQICGLVDDLEVAQLKNPAFDAPEVAGVIRKRSQGFMSALTSAMRSIDFPTQGQHHWAVLKAGGQQAKDVLNALEFREEVVSKHKLIAATEPFNATPNDDSKPVPSVAPTNTGILGIRELDKAETKAGNAPPSAINTNALLADLRGKAERGNAEAELQLGAHYLGGMGFNGVRIEKETKEGIKWIRRAAGHTNAEAQFLLGVLLAGGTALAGNPEEAFSWVQKAAQQGHAEGQWVLSLMYRDGFGARTNSELELEWLKKAVAQGLPDAEFRLAGKYYRGDSVPQDQERALGLFRRAAEHGLGCFLYGQREYAGAEKWLRKAAEAGEPEAQEGLGQLYHNGQVVEQDYAAAAAWWLKAARQGSASAQYRLGIAYERGRGVAQDYQQARDWYTKAARQGYADAQYKLAIMCHEGRGRQRDLAECHMWLTLAAAGGEPDSRRLLPGLELEMTPDQLQKAVQMESEFRVSGTNAVPFQAQVDLWVDRAERSRMALDWEIRKMAAALDENEYFGWVSSNANPYERKRQWEEKWATRQKEEERRLERWSEGR